MVNFQGGLTFNDSAQFQYSKFLDAMNLISFNKTASIVDPAAEPVDLYYGTQHMDQYSWHMCLIVTF
jgi:phage-related protein